MASCDIQIPHHGIRVFNENGELDHIICTGYLDGGDDDDDDDDDDGGGSGGDEDNKSETGCDRDDSEHFGETEDCAGNCQVQEQEEQQQQEQEQDDDDDDHCHNEDNIIALVQVGEDFLDGDDQSKELRELEKVASTETPVQLNELNVTTDEINEIHNCIMGYATIVLEL